MAILRSKFGRPNPVNEIHRLGPNIPASGELAIDPLYTTFFVTGSGTVKRLPALQQGVKINLHFLNAPTFTHSAKLLMPGAVSRQFGTGDHVQMVSLGNGAWRCTFVSLAAGPQYPPGSLYGLTLSNNASDATNDIDIAVGQAVDSTGLYLMALTSVMTKRLDAAWSAGTGNGGLDTGSIANTTYHIHIIQNPTTDVVDALFSTSPSAPTLPTGYTRFRRIGSVLRESAALVAFRQYGDIFKRTAQSIVRNSTTPITDTLLDMKVPVGIQVAPLVIADMQLSVAGSAIQLFSDGDLTVANESANRAAGTEYALAIVTGHWITNAAGQLRYSLLNSSGTLSFARIQTQGWIDGRGK